MFVLLLLPCAVAAHGDLHEQIAEVTRRIEREPDDASLHFKRGELRRFHRDWEAALKDLDRAAELDPELGVVDLARGRTFLQAGRPKEAVSALDRFLAGNPGHGGARVERARALAKLGRGLDAAAEYARAIDLLDRPRPGTYLERADALAGEGPTHLERAIRGLDEGIRRLGPAVTLQLKAIDLEVAAGRLDAALARLDRASAPFVRKETWLARRGEILKKAGRPREAREAFTSAVAAIASLPASRRRTKSMSKLGKRLRSELEEIREK